MLNMQAGGWSTNWELNCTSDLNLYVDAPEGVCRDVTVGKSQFVRIAMKKKI